MLGFGVVLILLTLLKLLIAAISPNKYPANRAH